MHKAWVANMVYKYPFTTILLEIPSRIRFYWVLIKEKRKVYFHKHLFYFSSTTSITTNN